MSVQKKAWIEPKLVVHGDVAKITQDTDKQYGLSDSFLFMGQPIMNRS